MVYDERSSEISYEGEGIVGVEGAVVSEVECDI